jgi:multiple sugar transport system substrate-binding protein
MIPQFQQLHPDIKLKEEPIGGNYWDTVNVQFAAGTVADVQLGDGYFFNVYVLKDSYVPLDDYFKQNNVDLANYDIVPNVATHAGKTYGMPAQLVVSGWYYNEDLFTQAGIPVPDENWTWDDVLSIATKLTDPSKKQYGILASNSDEFGWGPLLFSNGADWRNQDNTKCLLTDAGGVDAFQWYVDLIFKHKVSPTPSDTKALQGEFADPFSAGKIGLVPSGYQAIGNYLTRIGTRFKWGLLPTPKSPSTKNAYSEWNDQPYYLTSGAKKRNVLDQAATLAVFMGGEFVQGQIAIFRGSIPTIKKLQTGEAYLKAPPDNMMQVSKNLAGPKLMQAPYLFEHGEEFQQAYSTEVAKAFTGEKPPADALRDAVTAANKVLTKYAGQQ